MSTTALSRSKRRYVCRSCTSGGTWTGTGDSRGETAAEKPRPTSVGSSGSSGPPKSGARRSRRALRRPEGAAHGALDRAFRAPAVTESHLGLRRVDVHIHVGAGERELEQEGRPHAGGNRGAIGRLGGAHEAGGAHGAAVGREAGAA